MPKIGVLLQRQDSLYWWALRLIPTFIWIFTSWHTFTSDHIHYLATRHSLKVTRMEKNNLTDTELELFWQYTKSQRDANLQQHYLAYILTYITSIRPGSISLSDGGEKDIARGIMRDETLRWSDVDFFNTPDGRGMIWFRIKHIKDISNNFNYRYWGQDLFPIRERVQIPTHEQNICPYTHIHIVTNKIQSLSFGCCIHHHRGRIPTRSFRDRVPYHCVLAPASNRKVLSPKSS
jgi:hypothetical protein